MTTYALVVLCILKIACTNAMELWNDLLRNRVCCTRSVGHLKSNMTCVALVHELFAYVFWSVMVAFEQSSCLFMGGCVPRCRATQRIRTELRIAPTVLSTFPLCCISIACESGHEKEEDYLCVASWRYGK